MNLIEGFQVAWESLRDNKLRSLLTMLGIIIGIAAVIAVVAIGQGGRALLTQEMEKIGSNLFVVYVSWRSEQPRTEQDFTLTEIPMIKRLVPEVKYLVPESYSLERVNLKGGENQTVQVVGTAPDYQQVRNVSVAQGRFINQTDYDGARRVVVLDEGLAAEIFDRKNPLGQAVNLGNWAYTVVGVSAANDSFLTGDNPVREVYIPITALHQMYNHSWINQLEGQAVSRDQIGAAVNKTVKVLERRRRVEDRYSSQTLEEQIKMANRITGIMTLVIGAIAGISLVVGGIGVMNIMLVSVTERTREIGTRMALGARRRDILIQFLIEAVMLSLVGGLLGMIVGTGLAYAIAKLAHWPPTVSGFTIAVAVIFSSVVGLIFGLYPANRAAKMDPIEALRYE